MKALWKKLVIHRDKPMARHTAQQLIYSTVVKLTRKSIITERIQKSMLIASEKTFTGHTTCDLMTWN